MSHSFKKSPQTQELIKYHKVRMSNMCKHEENEDNEEIDDEENEDLQGIYIPLCADTKMAMLEVKVRIINILSKTF